MFLDTGPLGPPWREPPQPLCKSCCQPILDHHRTEDVPFPPQGAGAEMSGAYHAECAGPHASIARAMAMFARLSH